MKLRSLFLAAGLLAASPGVPSRAGIITTLATGDFGGWGTTDNHATPTFGQVITIPAGDDSLISITFNIQSREGSEIPYQAYIYNWAGTAVTGGPLFVSAPQVVAFSFPDYAPHTVSLGNTPVTAGQQYLVAFSTLGFSNGVLAPSSFQTSSDTSRGLFEYNNSDFFGLYFSDEWNKNGDFGALAFTAVLGPSTSVPEPSSIALMGSSVAFGLAGLTLRRYLKGD
jgi:hypothetical protein